MNCETTVLTREEAQAYADLQEKEAKIQLLNWAIQILGTGMNVAMARHRFYQKLEELKEKK
jgi:hypothetical protein